MEISKWYALLKERGEWEDFLREQRPHREAWFREEFELLKVASAPLEEALKRSGVSIDGYIWNLLNVDSFKFQQALPILLEHLSRDYPPEIYNCICHAIAAHKAEFAWDELLRIFVLDPPTLDATATSGRKTCIAFALVAIARAFEEHVPELFPLLRDRTRNGLERVYFLPVLEESRRDDARLLLEELKDDPDLMSAISAIRSRQRARRRWVRLTKLSKNIPPAVMMFELTPRRDVSRTVKIEPDGKFFWESVDACIDPTEMIGRNSLIEGRFPEKSTWRQADTQIYEYISQEAFDLWFAHAQKFGRRRTHIEVARQIRAQAAERSKKRD